MTDLRRSERQVLTESSRLLASTLDPAQVLDRLADLARAHLEVEVARFWLLDEAGQRLRLAVHKGRIRSPLPATEQGATPASLVGWVLTHRTSLALADVQQDPRLEKRAWFAAEGFASLLCAPLLLEGGAIGILSCLTRTRREFSRDDVALAEALAASAAMAVHNARVHAEALRRLEEIEAFQRVALEALASPDRATAMDAVVREVRVLLRSDAAAGSVVDPATGELETVSARGTRQRSRVPDHLGLAALARQEGRALRTDDLGSDPRFARPPALAEWASAEEIVSMIAAPVTDAANRPIALLWAFNRAPRPFSDQDEAALAGLARQAALALENARLVADLHRTVDELKTAQEAAVRGATLRAMGELAAGAAHHLNNLLAIVLGRSQLLLYGDRAPEIGGALRTIERAALDAADTVRRIQAFSRTGHGGSAAPIDLNRTVRESIDFTRSRWEHEARARGAAIDLVFEPGALPPVSGRNAELREALTSLILNAVEALPGAGRIAIRTWSEAGRAAVSISDSGPGMPEEVRARAFQPFFTTKGVRRLGLGLPVAYGLVGSHGGEISLDTAPGRGTTVTFWVPAAAASAEPASPAAGDDAGPRGRLLVVDDEADMREVLAEALIARGHTVTLAGDGREALACLEGGEFDLVITDLRMPDLDGWELASAVKAARAHLPVVLLTGWADAVEAAAGRVDAVIRKPFDTEKLAAAVSAALSRPPA